MLNLKEAADRVRREADRTRAAMEEMAGIMGAMAQEGSREGAEYQEILGRYRELSRLAGKATELLKPMEPAAGPVPDAAAPVPAASYDLAGIDAIRQILGPAGQPGATFHGEEVANLQRFLAAVGFPVPESEDYEEETRVAVQQFQARHGLKADGVVGAPTRKAINDLLKGS